MAFLPKFFAVVLASAFSQSQLRDMVLVQLITHQFLHFVLYVNIAQSQLSGGMVVGCCQILK